VTFDQLGLAEPLLRGVRAAGYASPTPIQEQAIPIALDGRDLIGCAQTGTGKTAAFVLPILDRLLASKPTGGKRPVRALVVTPTRELAVQIEEAAQAYAADTPLRTLSVLGGVSIRPQAQALRRGVDLLIATPGRLLDHLEQENVSLSKVEILTLDEADRMLDMGFINDIRKIVRAVPKRRQTLLFSATMPPEIRTLAAEILDAPREVTIGEVRSTADTVAQRAVAVGAKQKLDLLVHVLKTEPVESVLVFARTKRRADRIAKQLSKRGFATAAMHGNRSQNQRQRALGAFDSGDVQVLVATDVAARGIDVDGISHVVNFDVPPKPEDYIHRIGRTGRAQATGHALTFFDEEEADYIRRIEKHTGARLERALFEGVEVDESAPELPADRQQQRGQRGGGGKPKNTGGGGSSGASPRRRKRSGKRTSASGAATSGGSKASAGGEAARSGAAPKKGRRPNLNARRG
jgi:ATP-dependent RNA helicase RhlE